MSLKKRNINLKNRRTVFITGITSGIGGAVAFKFASEGWNIIGHYHSSHEKAVALKKQIQSLGLACHVLRADLTSKKQIASLGAGLEDFTIDSMVNNAGTYTASRHFSELSMDDLADTFMVNTFAPILLTTNVFIQMKERCFGRIVNISSIAAKYGGSSYSLHYGCSKRALEGLTKTLAREGAPRNVLVNTVRPGFIDTDFHKKFPKNVNSRIKMIPMKKMGTAEDVADIIYLLGSDENSFITNEIITISGGE